MMQEQYIKKSKNPNNKIKNMFEFLTLAYTNTKYIFINLKRLYNN